MTTLLLCVNFFQFLFAEGQGWSFFVAPWMILKKSNYPKTKILNPFGCGLIPKWSGNSKSGTAVTNTGPTSKRACQVPKINCDIKFPNFCFKSALNVFHWNCTGSKNYSFFVPIDAYISHLHTHKTHQNKSYCGAAECKLKTVLGWNLKARVKELFTGRSFCWAIRFGYFCSCYRSFEVLKLRAIEQSQFIALNIL